MRDDTLVELIIDGQAVPQGSLTPFIHYRSHKVVVPQKESVKTWRNTAAMIARSQWAGEPTPDPLYVRATFYLARPRHHFGTGRNSGKLKPSAPAWCMSRKSGDIDKLARALLDACTGVIWVDDSQVVSLDVNKFWTDTPYTYVRIIRLGSAGEKVG